jgi:serine-type D-Ala-D-Ala carboxypeptidase/endopeptidase (penicillin-binding protein 4)
MDDRFSQGALAASTRFNRVLIITWRSWHAQAPRRPEFIKLLMVALFVAGFGSVLAGKVSAKGLPDTVLQALQRADIPLDAVGAFVQEVDATAPIVAVNPTRPMNPASVMKLVTTYAGLELLGPPFTWRTMALAAEPPVEGVLHGDLYIKGGGDPKLTIENFWLLLRSLRGAGLREIKGDLIVDSSYFDITQTDAAAFDREPLKPYNVLPHGLLVNFKAVKFQFTPSRPGGPITVTADPVIPQITIFPRLRATGGRCGDWRQNFHARVDDTGDAAKVIFSGTMPSTCGPQVWYMSLLSHPSFIYGTFKNLWQEIGGTISGGWRVGQADPAFHVLASYDSVPLTDAVRDINKFSNNVMARHLYLTLSAEPEGTGGREDRSMQILNAWLRAKELDIPDLAIENGSGLSRVERISAQSIVRLLVNAYASQVMPEFIGSLPLVAVDGTMRTRLRRDIVAGQAHIKTGGLNQVSTIAGYVRAVDGRRYAVAFFVNHANAAGSTIAQDALLRWVHRQGDQNVATRNPPGKGTNR